MPSRRLSAVIAQFDLDLLAVAPQRLDFEAASEDLAVSGAQEALQARLVGVAVRLRNDQLAELAAERFAARPAEDLFGLRIPVRDGAVFVHLDEGIERGIDDAARQLLAFAQRFLRQPAFGHVAADEEMPPHRLGPGAHPRQRHDAPVLVDEARIEIPRALSAPRGAHFVAGVVEIVGVMNSIALWPIISSGAYPRMVSELGLT